LIGFRRIFPLKMSNFWPEELRKSSRASKSCFLNGRY
jgi:hypothetical protein